MEVFLRTKFNKLHSSVFWQAQYGESFVGGQV